MTEKEMNEKKKQYLNRYKNAVKKYNSLQEQEELIRAEMGTGAIEYSGMPKAHKKTDLSDYMVRLEKILYKIADKKREMQEIRLEIEDKITDIDDGIQSRVLYLRYIRFLKWGDICVEIGYSWRQVHRAHSQALKKMNID